MRFNAKPGDFEIKAENWERNGSTGARWSRLTSVAVLRVGGVSVHLHLVAIAVYDRDDSEQGTTIQIAESPDDQEELEDWSGAAHPDGRFDTIKIGDHDYAVFASPFC